MIGRPGAIALLLFVGATRVALAQDAPAVANQPLLRLEAGGPTSNVTALAFSADGDTLYAAGYDKVVRVWARNPKSGAFDLDEKRYFRVPINPGTEGAINAMAVSPDGAWLAVGGRGMVRQAAGYLRAAGRVWPVIGLTPEVREDQGVIHVFGTRKPEVRLLRAHTGVVVALAFAPARAGQPPLLLSAANGWNAQTSSARGEVRAWDLDKEVSIGAWVNLPPPGAGGLMPELAALPYGPDPKQVRVAVAWGDSHQGAGGNKRGYLRILDLAQPGGPIQTVEDGYYNTTLAVLADARTLLSGSFLSGRGRVGVWDLTATPPVVQKEIALSAPKQTYLFPERLSLLNPEGAGQPERVAVVVRQLSEVNAAFQDNGNRLRILDLAGQTMGEVLLWPNSGIGPVLATAPRGRHVAVAGHQDHGIRVFEVADLLQSKNQPQVLHSMGATMRQVTFAVREDKSKTRLGLVMNETQGAGPGGGLLFDFQQRQLTDKVQGWTPARPQPGTWSVGRSPDKKAGEAISVYQGDVRVSQIVLPREQELSAPPVLVPPLPPLNEALLITAGYVRGKGLPALHVYQVRTGKLLRWYTGHSAPVSALALSPDGRLLASAADDQTVAVWSLADMKEILGRQGRLSGVAVEKQGANLVAVPWLEDGPAAIAPGTVITGLAIGGKELQPASGRDFYETFWKEKPGTPVTLHTAVGQEKKDLALTVDQGIDERKPLFSLFVTRASPVGTRDWLGWNALGPYDASRQAAESYLGWHFNTGEAKEPTRFALIEEYRDKYYQKDILARLVATASLAEALKPPPPPPPPEFGEALGVSKAGDGDFLVRQAKVAIQLPIRNVQPADKVYWQLNSGQPQPLDLDQAEGDLWSIPLELPRGRHTIRVNVERPQREGRSTLEFHTEMAFRYQRAAPRLEMQPVKPNARASSYVQTAQQNFPVKLLLHTPGEAPDVNVALWLDDDKKPQKIWSLKHAAEPQEISAVVPLSEGRHVLKVQAQNEPALAGFEADESHTVALDVAVNSPAPVVAIERVEAVDGGDEVWDFKPGQHVIVDVPRVRIVGTIKTQASQVAAEWGLAAQGARRILALKPGDLQFAQEIDLKPGSQTLHFFAKILKGKDEGTSKVSLMYRPQLPTVVFQGPEEMVVREPGGRDETTLTVEAKLVPPPTACPVPFKIKATLWRDRDEIREVTIDSTASALAPQKIILKPGPNRIQIRLSHEWGGSSSDRALVARFIRPPRIVKVEADKVAALPLVNLRAEVRSSVKPQASSIIVQANGLRREFAEVNISKAEDDPTKWTVQMKAVALVLDETKKEHSNTLRLVVANDDGPSDLSPAAEVTYREPPPPPPLIALLAPTSANVILEEPETTLVFTVFSTKDPKRVAVFDMTQEQTRELPVQLQSHDGDRYVYTTARLPLQWGMNKLKVAAINDGGSDDKLIALTVPPMPVSLSVDLIRPVGKGGLVKLPDGARAFPAVGDGHVFLEGKVRVGNKNPGGHTVRIYVNGFQQLPVKLGPPVPGRPWERPFKAKLVLNLPENSVELDLPTLTTELRGKEFVVPCQAPVRGQYLHILLLAPDLNRRQGDDLKKSITQALALKEFGTKELKSTVFERVQVDVMTYVNYLKVDSLLFNIQGRLKGRPTDVVMFYFLGRETVNSEDRVLWTSETRTGAQGELENVLALNKMVNNHFQQFPGAQVLFLDLGSNMNVAKGPVEENRYRLALFRHVALQSPNRKLFQELTKEMPQTAWLDQLRANLVAHFQGESFFESIPRSLKMKLTEVSP